MMAEPSSPALPVKLALKCRSLEAILDETFLSISSLREALQMGATPGRAMCDEHISATGAPQEKVISRELKKLSELKHRYRWQRAEGSTESSQRETPLAHSDGWSSESEGSWWQGSESVLSLKLELQKKDAEIRNLNATVERLVAKKEKLERRVRKLVERKGPSHGGGIATLGSSWDHVSEEDCMAARVAAVEQRASSVPHPSGNGAPAECERVNTLVKSAGKGEERTTTVPRAAGNGMFGRHGVKMFMESRREDVRHIKAKAGAITPEKLSNGVSEKQRRRGGDAEVMLEKQAGFEQLRKVFDGAVAEVTETVVEFCKAMVVHMRKAKWDIEEGGVEWVIESHKALAVQSYVCMRMFRGFEHEDFYMSGRLSCLLDPAKHREECRQQFNAMVQMVEEPLDLLAGVASDSAFGQFCRKKFLQIFSAPMEEALLGDLRHRHCLLQEAVHPRWSRFYQAFVRMAKAIWTVHKLAFTSEPRVSIFQAERGADFSTCFMMSHISNLELASDTHNLLPKVAFTVMPGFRIGEHILLRCRVYLNGMKMSSPVNHQG
eukprot:c15032_g1_i1 orf=180-1829(+)